MNGVLIAAIAILAFNLIWGYRKGFLITIYSMISWIIAIVFVAWTTPYVANYLIEHTTIDEQITEYAQEQLAEMIGVENTEIADDEENQKIALTDEKTLQDLGFQLPKQVESQFGEVGAITNRLFEESKIKEEVSQNVSHMVVYGITFVIMLLLTRILLKVVEHVLRVISKIPVIHFANQTLGVLAGGVKGMVFIWLCFAVIALVATSDFGRMMITSIYKEQILIWLYENNILLTIMLMFF